MQRFVKPLAVVLAVPLICTALALTSRNESDRRWQAGLRRQFLVRRQMPDERVIARYSLPVLCGDPRTAAGVRPCRSYNLLSSLATASSATGVLGLVFLAAIAATGAACRRRRDLLRRAFKAGLYATVTGLVLLVLLHGALGIASLFVLGEVIQRWPATMVLALAAATIAAAASMIQVALAATRRAGASVVARELSPGDQSRLVEWVRDVAGRAGARPPDHIVAGLTPGIFVTDAAVVCLDGRRAGRTLYLPLPLARILSEEELRGLVAHELAHFAGDEEAVSHELLPLYAGARRSIQALSRDAVGIRSLTALPALSVLSLFMDSFEPGMTAVRREREAAADRSAAAVVGRETFAAALVKAHAFTPAWHAVATAMDRAVVEGTQYVNASILFEQVAAASAGTERLLGVGSLSVPHPTDIHPSLAERLHALGVRPGTVARPALATQPPRPGIALVADYEALEQDLSQVEHRIAAIGWGRVEEDEVTAPARA